MTPPSIPTMNRRGFLTLATAGAAGALFSVAIGPLSVAHADDSTSAGVTPGTTVRKRELRAMWIASVVNINWPSRTGLSPDELKAELIGWLDLAVSYRLNAVFIQVRPTADAFWPSPLEPWSKYLTGTQGGDPGFDPLAFMVEEAHARNLELHTWYNPYRVAMDTNRDALVPEHPARVHPEWVWAFGGKLYFDPGLPEVQEHIYAAILDSVAKYDIDGVHFDDYFYPYPVAGQTIPDAATFAAHGGGFTDIGDWRRHNVDTFVRTISERIKQTKPWVKFGISPFGIWRNRATDPLGSDTNGSQSYDGQFADSRKWVLEGWLDYINPQIYWQIGLAVADYAKLAPWWADVAKASNTQLYIGEAVYKVTSGAFTDPAELSNHLALDAQLTASGRPVHGNVYYSSGDVRTNALGAMTRVREDHYAHPAIIPTMPHLPAVAVRQPVLSRAAASAGGVELQWQDTGPARTKATSFAIYRVAGSVRSIDTDDARNLIATVRTQGGTVQRWVDATAIAGTTYTYVVTALDRLWNESAASKPRTTGN